MFARIIAVLQALVIFSVACGAQSGELIQPALVSSAEPIVDSLLLVEAGRRIYQEGVLPSGQPLRGKRDGDSVVSGADAACIMCHRRSGMGASEGKNTIPPIIGQALFQTFRKPGERSPRRAAGIQFTDFPFHTRPPYNDASLARALREGVSPSDYHFQYLMPRYELADPDMAALIAYLTTLSAAPSPGIAGAAVHIATVVTPGNDPKKRRAFLDVLNACVAERQPVLRAQPETAANGDNGWPLHIWELTGPATTWKAQLLDLYARQPVFAMVSGLGGDEWEPVHQFCEQQHIPCLFPNTDLPGGAEDSNYNFYFSKGVLLEAETLAHYLTGQKDALGITRVVQVSREHGAGAAAAAHLRGALKDSSLLVEDRIWDGNDARKLSWIAGLGRNDVLVLWLRQSDVANMVKHKSPPPAQRPVFVSGILAGQEHAPLNAAWRKSAYLIYPFETPGRWALRARFNLLPWLTQMKLKPQDERLQGNTLAACATFADSMYRTQGVWVRDYFLDMAEAATSAMGNAGATAAFPHFLLGTNQRFASKGAYVVRFAESKGALLAKESDWIVP